MTPGLLTQIIVIYWTRHQVWLPRQTMAECVGLAAEWLKPIYHEINKGVLRGGYVQVDETPIRYLALGNGKTKLGYLWTCADPRGDVSFHWATSRAATCLDNIIPADFRGTLQCDGYEAYDCFARRRGPHIALAGCMAHVRRKFFDAREQAPRITGWILKHIGHLYLVEKDLRKTRAGPKLRQAQRASNSRLVMKRLHSALVRLKSKHRYLPRSLMDQAIDYALRACHALFFQKELYIINTIIQQAWDATQSPSYPSYLSHRR